MAARSGLSPRDTSALVAFAEFVTGRAAEGIGQIDDRAAELAAGLLGELTPPPGKLSDSLRVRIVELVDAVDEHNGRCPDDQLEIPRQPLAIACRSLCGWLERRHPGRSVEVRVPPYAAVQCGIGPQGPTHTRGTPPNVVETEPLVFLRLATGRLDWQRAKAARQIAASGQRADLSEALPIHRTRR
ncbi:hypothetical protein FOE78_19270 [Microlunatus elymi]|uniref:Bacterial SCP orthologue domain-containing protein n=1 Tax=Microlunatus elymi TaxID=2596828 RepID=A0A516Q2W0_9ACTN|nr:sterol carrier family protein [Microlunatus elymi]QDP97764.1 hypothetical protein FOE78_19270 [Microlunatus elymi]